MTTQEDARAELERLLNEWLAANDEADRIRREYISSGSITPGQPIQWPEKTITPEAISEMDAAEKKEKQAHRAYLDARKRFWQSVRQPA